MNACFFSLKESTLNKLDSIAIQDGKPVGPGSQGNTTGNGTGIICWNGKQLRHYTGVQNGSSPLIPTGSGTWAQGGYSLNLYSSDWENEFKAQVGDPTLLTSGSPRTGILINENDSDVYLFITTSTSAKVEHLRGAMRGFASIGYGESSGPWKAILTDGGKSAQLYCAEKNIQTYLNRPVPQIIALKNKN